MALNEYTFNIGECCLWIAVSIVLFIKSARDAASVRRTLRFLAISFFLFGLSDFVEAHTGAWWKPLWLLFLKGGCIAAFVFGFARYYKITKGSQRT